MSDEYERDREWLAAIHKREAEIERLRALLARCRKWLDAPMIATNDYIALLADLDAALKDSSTLRDMES